MVDQSIAVQGCVWLSIVVSVLLTICVPPTVMPSLRRHARRGNADAKLRLCLKGKKGGKKRYIFSSSEKVVFPGLQTVCMQISCSINYYYDNTTTIIIIDNSYIALLSGLDKLTALYNIRINTPLYCFWIIHIDF